MSESLVMACAGAFPFSRLFDVTLCERSQISTPDSPCNIRIVPVPSSDSPLGVVAIGRRYSPFSVGVYDVNSKRQICQCVGHQEGIWGLSSLSCETISSNPIIVSAGNGDSQILFFDAQNGSKLGQTEQPPQYIFRLLQIPEWNDMDVFAGGGSGIFRRYDIRRKRKIGEYSGHRDPVFGLSGIVSQNLLISASLDRTVRLWSRDECTCQHVINLSVGAFSCCFVEEKNLIVVGLGNGSLEVWDVRRLSERVGSTRIGSLVWETVVIDEDRVVCGCDDGKVAVFNPSTRRVSSKTKLPSTVFGVCVLGRSLDDPERESLLERWKFWVKIFVERSVFLVRVYVGDGILGVASIIMVPCWMMGP